MSEHGFDWKSECQPVLDKAQENFHAGIMEWLPVANAVALYFLECLPPHDHEAGSFATGEAYDHDDDGRPVYLCFRNFSLTGLREEPVNEVVCQLRAVPNDAATAYACYMNRRQFREARRLPLPPLRLYTL